MKSPQLMIFMIFITLPCLSMDGYYFFDLNPTINGKQLGLSWTPQRLVSYEQMNDPRYSYDNFNEASFDAYIQAAITLLDELDAKRNKVKATEKKPLLLTTLQFALTTRRSDGTAIDRTGFETTFFLSGTPGQTMVRQGELEHRFAIAQLKTPEGYQKLLAVMGQVLASSKMALPKEESFMVECYYSPAFLIKDLGKKVTLSPEAKIAYRRLFIASNYSQQEHLATSYCRKSTTGLETVTSGHLHFLREAAQFYSSILKEMEKGEKVSEDLEDYLEMVPTDFKALELLVKAYVKEGKRKEALAFIAKNRDLLVKSSEVQHIRKQLIAEKERQRDRLLADRKNFARDEAVSLNILSPQHNDYVGGNALMVFEMKGHTQEILRMDVMMDDDVLGSIYQAPYQIPFNLSSHSGRVHLKLVAWFKNKTYQVKSLTVKPLFIADESEVNLATLRVSATQGPNYLLHLNPMDFSISEMNDKRPIHNFRRDKAPLRVAILLDTSFSMSGDKLYRAQYAANTFLSKLGKADRACIYTFDQHVMKLSNYTNDFKGMQSVLMTLSPHHSTSLHDALVKANQDLSDMEGNRVIIVVSDGRDSASKLDKEHVFNSFRKSTTMVYSVVLNLDQTQNIEGKAFMKKISDLTGSASIEVDQMQNLHDTFNKIYDELRSFYLMDFYSSQKDFTLNQVKVKVSSHANVQTRFSRQRGKIIWQ